MITVYSPQLGKQPTLTGLSILSDCKDTRTAHVSIIVEKSGPAQVDISLQDPAGAALAGTCTEMRVLFPGKTTGGQIISPQTYQIKGVPDIFHGLTDAGTQLTREAGIGDGDSLSLSLGRGSVPPVIRFWWLNAKTRPNFATTAISLPLTPLAVNGSPLVPI